MTSAGGRVVLRPGDWVVSTAPSIRWWRWRAPRHGCARRWVRSRWCWPRNADIDEDRPIEPVATFGIFDVDAEAERWT